MIASTYACVGFDPGRMADNDGEELRRVLLLNSRLALTDIFDDAVAFTSIFGGTVYRLDAVPVFSPADAYFTQGT